MDKQSGSRAGGAGGTDWVRKLAVDVAVTGSRLVKAQLALAEAVRGGVGEHPYKVRTVQMAAIAHPVVKSAYASAQTKEDRRTCGYDPTVITLPDESPDRRRR